MRQFIYFFFKFPQGYLKHSSCWCLNETFGHKIKTTVACRERILKTYKSSGEKENCSSWGIGVGWESVGSARVSEEKGLCRLAWLVEGLGLWDILCDDTGMDAIIRWLIPCGRSGANLPSTIPD